MSNEWSQDDLKTLREIFPDDVRTRHDGTLFATITKDEARAAIQAYPSHFGGRTLGQVPKGEEDLAKAYPSMYSPKD